MHWDILDSTRTKLLPQFSFLKDYGFYLAGGTALALWFGHRKSIDFDFYCETSFNEMEFENNLVQKLPDFKVTQRSQGTIIGICQTVDLSFFHYPYPLVEPIQHTETLDICPVPDIAAMKLIAISQRGIRRDFLDLYVICRKHELFQVFNWAQKKYPQFDPHVCLKALTYFDDADSDESGRGMELSKPVPWADVKVFFQKEAVRFAKVML
ncbi:MAG: nucleotidyl transferase AbiEii/AbiGii toxin family protein [Deltaproteobacteria bacterium]|nr:nucleotidyl transferase AbiEii/AbiGii toxin family protein [Deltaproteobacteria bacterium]